MRTILAPDGQPRLYNDHVRSKRFARGSVSTWEIMVKLFSDEFVDRCAECAPKTSERQESGISLAYCDNDGVRKGRISSDLF